MDDSVGVAKVTSLPLRHCAPAPPIQDLSEEVAQLLAEAEPMPGPAQVTAPASLRQRVPDPSHRNAVACPQCDGVIWRSTLQCVHCGLNLAIHAWREARVTEARRQQRLTRWSVGLALGAMAVLILSVFLPISIGFPIGTLALLVVVGVSTWNCWL